MHFPSAQTEAEILVKGVTRTHFHTHFSVYVFPSGKVCESESWIVDSVPSLPRWDKTQ